MNPLLLTLISLILVFACIGIGKQVIAKTSSKFNISSSPFQDIFLMDISFSEATYLQTQFKAEEVFVLTSVEATNVKNLITKAIQNEKYPDVNLSNYSLQTIGMTINGKKSVYAFAFKEKKGFRNSNPKKEFFSSLVNDGGVAFIEAIVDLEKKSVVLMPHGSS